MRKLLSFLLILTLTITPFITLPAINPGGSWSEQIQLSSNVTQPSVAPQVAADCDGNGLVVWKQPEPEEESLQIYANRYDANNGWQGPAGPISNPANGDVAHAEDMPNPPALKFDCKGNAIALWAQGDIISIYYNRYDATTGWENPATLARISEDNASFPQFAFDCNGNGFAVWEEGEDVPNSIVYALRYYANGTWAEESIPLSEEASIRPALAIDCNGNAIVVWDQTNDPRAIFANTYNATTGLWEDQPTTPISDITSLGDAQKAQVAYDCNGIATAVWQQDDGEGNIQIYVNRYTPGSGWGTAPTAPISSDTLYNASNAQLVVDCKDNVMVIWQQDTDDGSNPQIFTNRYANGSWGTPPTTPISNPAQGPTAFPELVIDCAGNITASWHQGTTPNIGIYTNRYTIADGWASAPSVPHSKPSLGTARFPQMAATCNGFVGLVYQQGRNPGEALSTEQIQGQLFITTPQPLNVRVRQECHRFPTQIDLINVISWDPPASENPIVKYKVYCAPYVAPTSCCSDCCDCQIVCCTCPCNDAKFVGEVPATGPLYFCHHGRCAGTRYSYCVTAVDSTGSETPVPVNIATS